MLVTSPSSSSTSLDSCHTPPLDLEEISSTSSPSPSPSSPNCSSTFPSSSTSLSSSGNSTPTNYLTTSSTTSSIPLSSSPFYSNDTFLLKDYLKTMIKQIDTALEDVFSSDLFNKHNKLIIDSMKYSLLNGGKRLRPILCLASCELFSSDNDSSSLSLALPTALAIELIHTMSLIHDDLPAMDNDDIRRGKPTNHVVYGEATAILAGDALLSYAFEYVATRTDLTRVQPLIVLEIIARLGRSVGVNGLAGGQARDLEFEEIMKNKIKRKEEEEKIALSSSSSSVSTSSPSSSTEDISEEITLKDVEWVHLKKTASLLKVCCSTGALIGGASKEDIKLLEKYAENLGLAYQIIDDVLDCTSSSDVLGKTVGKDKMNHKPTYLEFLSVDEAKDLAKELVTKAKNSLLKFGDKALPLLALADFVINRQN